MDILIKVIQLFLCFTLLVGIHELGHFLMARVFGIRVEKFYIFFDPWFSLFKFKRGGTEYGVGWLPLGGYVKIAGMIDESLDTEQMKQPVRPDEFRAKPAWQRFLVMIAGIDEHPAGRGHLLRCLVTRGAKNISPTKTPSTATPSTRRHRG